MATCLYFNLQVLPLNTNSNDFIGEVGYTKIFKVLDLKLKENIKNKKLHNAAFRLPRSDYYLVPFTAKFEKSFVYGRLKKFDQVNKVTELYSEKDLYTVSSSNTGTSKQFNFSYCFDPKLHIFAIENTGGKLPSNTTVIEEFLIFVFNEIVQEQFPKYHLTCHALKETSELLNVEKSSRFKKVAIEITYTNPEDAEDALESLIDKENRDNNVGSVNIVQKAENGSEITGLTSYAKAMLKLAGKTGNATITYFNEQKSKWDKFSFQNFPVKILINRVKGSEDVFKINMFNSIKKANDRSK